MSHGLSNEAYRTQKLVLAVILPGIAGAVNASALLAVGVYTSHVTGHVARAGDALSRLDWTLFGAELAITLAYMFGVIFTTGLVEIALVRERARHAVPLLIEASILALYAGWAEYRTDVDYRTTMTILLTFGMGMQNALVTRAFGAVVRTTHLTGIVTDIGIELAHLVFVLRSLIDSGDGFRAIMQRLYTDPQWTQLRTHLSVLGSFFGGATLGPLMLLYMGQGSMSLLVIVLLGLAWYDLRHGIRREPRPR